MAATSRSHDTGRELHASSEQREHHLPLGLGLTEVTSALNFASKFLEANTTTGSDPYKCRRVVKAPQYGWENTSSNLAKVSATLTYASSCYAPSRLNQHGMHWDLLTCTTSSSVRHMLTGVIVVAEDDSHMDSSFDGARISHTNMSAKFGLTCSTARHASTEYSCTAQAEILRTLRRLWHDQSGQLICGDSTRPCPSQSSQTGSAQSC